MSTTTTPAPAPATTDRPQSAVDLLRHLVEQRPGGEVRPQQERMVDAVAKAITTNRHLIVQAGTGTGKSLGYLVPAIGTAVAAGQRVVVSTATKQLGEQLVTEDLPTLARLIPQVGGPSFTYTLSKGRANFACRSKIHELTALDEQAPDEPMTDALFEIAAPRSEKAPSREDLSALNALLQWAETTQTGDRTEAPAAPDKVWDQISTDAAGCPGAKACPFSDDCFAEANRAQAAEADIVVTNHAQVAQDLRNGNVLFGDYDVLITDEMHELVAYLSSAWGQELAPSKAKQALALAARRVPKSPDGERATELVKSAIEDLDALADLLGQEEGGEKPDLPGPIRDLMLTISRKVLEVATTLKRASEREGKAQAAAEIAGAAGKAAEICETIVTIAEAEDGYVRWLEPARGPRQAVLKVAPLWVGPMLQKHLGDKTLVATSATILVGNSFDAAVRELALGTVPDPDADQPAPPRGFDTLDVGTPFNYAQQGILYVPGRGFPEPVGQDRFEHTAAVLDELTDLITAAGGRTLALFTTTKAARDAADHLRRTLATPVLCQGDAPPTQLLDEFAEVEETTLCATMGFWHGVDVQGSSLSLVVMDKIPFAPMNDPLMSARRRAADEAGRNGFKDVYVSAAAVMLAQGAGRLIRSMTDRGVVAILDTRVFTKQAYTREMSGALPPFYVCRDREKVVGSLERLTGGTPASARKPATAAARTGAATGAAAPAATKARKAPRSKASTRSLARKTRGTTPKA